MDALIGSIPELKKKETVVPRSRAHIMEASDCVFELFGWRTLTRPVAKNRLPYFVPKTPGFTLFCQLPFIFIFFPCSADHERDWPPCKVIFRVVNQCAECEKQDFSLNNNNNNIFIAEY